MANYRTHMAATTVSGLVCLYCLLSFIQLGLVLLFGIPPMLIANFVCAALSGAFFVRLFMKAYTRGPS